MLKGGNPVPPTIVVANGDDSSSQPQVLFTSAKGRESATLNESVCALGIRAGRPADGTGIGLCIFTGLSNCSLSFSSLWRLCV